jgi:NAD(P)-dependent dehydrogenase (short-subunit alcohol dehydrogenase family)
MLLKGQGVLITGGSLGIGKSVADACVQAGASVLICGRHADLVAEAEADLKGIASPDQLVLGRVSDVADPEAVSEMVKAAITHLEAFSGVVNCAGITGPAGPVETNDVEEWISTIHTNLIGTMLVSRAVIPHFRKIGHGKIVNFSGGGATSPRPRFSAYSASKAAVVRLTETLAYELNDTKIFVNAVAPGAVNTRMLEDVLKAGPTLVGKEDYQRAVRQKSEGGASPMEAAQLCVTLLSAEGDGISGRLISAVWDPWRTLVSFKARLHGTDIYTLRRIVPKDRGLDWN